MRVPIVPILSTLQLHSGMDCCLPTYVVISLFHACYAPVLVCEIVRNFSGVISTV